jgi:hypothetical protein
MPVIVLTTIEPPPPPPTGFGGNLAMPGGAVDFGVLGSLRTTDDENDGLLTNNVISAVDNGISGSLRVPDDAGALNTFMLAVHKLIGGSLRAPQDIPAITPDTGGNILAGSPDIGAV